MKYCDFIKQTIQCKNNIEWNYYDYRLNTNNILNNDASSNFIRNYFSNGQKIFPLLLEPNTADEFIDEYFRAGQKELLLFHNVDRQYQLPPERATHTVSGFFLGLLIEKCLMQDKSLCINHKNLFPFPYLWFLTFLYHDYGYCIAEKDDSPILFPQHAPITYIPNPNGKLPHEYTAMRKIRNKLKITFSPFSQYPNLTRPCNHHNQNLGKNLLAELTHENNLISKNAKLYFSNGSVIEKTQYRSSTITRYMNYRINEFKTVDHGIVGGFLFYDRLLKNYILAYKQAQKDWYYGEAQLKDFYYNGRHFFMEQIPIFSYIADCIISHNIFKQFDDENSRELYEIYGLRELYKEDFKQITFQSNPLLYILCVADTMEPIKTYQKDNQDLTANAISKAMQIDYSILDRSLTFSSGSPEIDISLLHKKAMDLMYWTSAKCSELVNDSFTVYLQYY